jgi:hypothetical protein
VSTGAYLFLDVPGTGWSSGAGAGKTVLGGSCASPVVGVSERTRSQVGGTYQNPRKITCSTTQIRLFVECFYRALGKKIFVKYRTRQSPTLGNDHVYREQGSRHRNTLCKKPVLSVIPGHSAKYFFIFFFLQPNFLWYNSTLYRPTCTILTQL